MTQNPTNSLIQKPKRCAAIIRWRNDHCKHKAKYGDFCKKHSPKNIWNNETATGLLKELRDTTPITAQRKRIDAYFSTIEAMGAATSEEVLSREEDTQKTYPAPSTTAPVFVGTARLVGGNGQNSDAKLIHNSSFMNDLVATPKPVLGDYERLAKFVEEKAQYYEEVAISNESQLEKYKEERAWPAYHELLDMVSDQRYQAKQFREWLNNSKKLSNAD